MAWKNNKRQFGYICAGGAFILLVIMGYILATTQNNGPDKSRTAPFFLLSMCGAALLGAASIALLKRPPHRIPRSRHVILREIPVAKAVQEKQRHFFYHSVIGLLSPLFANFEDANAALKTDIDVVTRGSDQQYTVADLERFLLRHLVGQKHGLSLLRPAFYQVRAALNETLYLSNRRIRPSTRIETLFPKAHRAACWTTFFQKLSVPVRPLELADGYKWIAVLAMLPFLCLASVGVEHGPALAAIIGFGGFILVFCGFHYSLRKLGLALEIPTGCTTVGDLVRQLAHHELKTHVTWTKEQLIAHIQNLLNVSTAIPQNQIQPDARLSDLGLCLTSPL